MVVCEARISEQKVLKCEKKICGLFEIRFILKRIWK